MKITTIAYLKKPFKLSSVTKPILARKNVTIGSSKLMPKATTSFVKKPTYCLF